MKSLIMQIQLLLVALLLAGTCQAELSSRPDPESGPTLVKVHGFLVDLDGIDSANQSYDANFFLELRWSDPRLADPSATERSLPLGSLWHPGVLLVNQIFVRKSLPELVTVSPGGQVTYRQQFIGRLSQPLALRDFPFDSQKLQLQFSSIHAESDQLVFQIDEGTDNGMSTRLSIADWKANNWTLAPAAYQPSPSAPPLSGFSFEIDVERESDYYLIKVLIPLLLILVMASSVFWIHPKESGVQIGVATSSMITLIAYRFAIGSALPDIPYLTRMDIFILACTVLVVGCLIEVVITSRLAAAGLLRPALLLDRVMRFIFPAVVALITWYAFLLF